MSCGTKIRDKEVRTGVNQGHRSSPLYQIAVGDQRLGPQSECILHSSSGMGHPPVLVPSVLGVLG